MIKTRTPLIGWAFNDVLNELHQLVFEGVPSESEPFELTLLEREYIAYVLACYPPMSTYLSPEKISFRRQKWHLPRNLKYNL